MKIMHNPRGLTRPPRETWSVGARANQQVDFQKDNLVSTHDLLRQTHQIPEEGVSARYAFQRDCSRMQPVSLKQYGLAAAQGAAWGALIGLGIAFGTYVITNLFDALSLGGVGRLPLPFGSALGSMVGAILSVSELKQEHSDYSRHGESIGGTLKGEHGPDGQKHLKFYLKGWQGPPTSVDLEAHAQAPVVAGGEPGVRVEEPQWWQASYPTVQNKAS